MRSGNWNRVRTEQKRVILVNSLFGPGLALAGLLYIGGNAAGAGSVPFHYVRDYGATGDGSSIATAAIQKAVDACAAAGGGKVIIPPGLYVTGPIFLKSHVEVEIESGAVLSGNTNINDYPMIDGRWEGVERKVYASLFTGENLEHVSITGRGTIDGRGAVWWDAHRRTSALRRQKGITGREPENPSEAALKWPRPRLINLYHCTNVLVRDLTLVRSPSWTVHPVYCQSVTLDNLTIKNPADSPNTDAVDPDSCRDVRISNCHFDVGDDCIVIKSGYNQDGRRVGVPCENVVINNCTFAHGHGGVVIGSEMSGSVRNVSVVNCIFDGTQRGLRVKTSLGRGGVVEDFLASGLVMRNITESAFSVTSAYDSEAKESAANPAPEIIPSLRHFHWSEITVVNAGKIADLSGLPESALEDISLSHVQVRGAKTGLRCVNAKQIVLQDLDLQVASGPVLDFQNVSDLEVLRLVVSEVSKGTAVVACRNVSQAMVRNCKVARGTGVFLKSMGTDNTEIRLEENRLAPGMTEQEP